MGVRGFYKYISKNIPYCSRKINIFEEIEKYKIAKGTTPVVVINLWTLCNKFDNETKDTVFGGRLNKIKQKFGDFLSRLVDSGAELYFVFKNPCRDEQRNFQIWSQTEEREYANGIMMIEKIDELKRIDKIVKFYEKKQTNIFNKCFPFNNIISVILAQTAENYGTICGPENVNTITTTNHARLANLKNAMAIIGLDTHYFFYEGSWKFWSPEEMKGDYSDVIEFDKNVIMAHFGLEYKHMPLFAVLASEKHLETAHFDMLNDFFGPRKFQFENIAGFVKEQNYPLTLETYRKITQQIFKRCDYDPRIAAVFKKSVDAFDTNFNSSDVDEIRMTTNDYMSYAHQIMLKKAIVISPSFQDMRKKDIKLFRLVARSWIQRTIGILTKHELDPKPMTIIFKESHDGDFVAKQIAAIIPDFKIPSLKMLILGWKMFQNHEKMKLLFWMSGIDDMKPKDLENIPEENLGDVIILLHLLKNECMKVSEACCILQTIIDVKNGKVSLESLQYPEIINERAFRLSFLYTKMYFVFFSCLSSIGMKNLVSELAFDNVYYQKLYADIEFEETELVYNQTEIIGSFIKIIKKD